MVSCRFKWLSSFLIISRTRIQRPHVLFRHQPCIPTPHSHLWDSLYHPASAWEQGSPAWGDTHCSYTQALRYVAIMWLVFDEHVDRNKSSFLSPQARVSLPGGLAMHSIPGRQVCIDTGLPHFFHMPPPAHAHAPAPSSPQPPPSPHSSHTHKVGAGRHERGRLFHALSLHVCFSWAVSILLNTMCCHGNQL